MTLDPGLTIWGHAMQSVKELAKEIVAQEGGFVDDPDDPGGATKYGVTLGTLRRLGLFVFLQSSKAGRPTTSHTIQEPTTVAGERISTARFYWHQELGSSDQCQWDECAG